MLLMCHYSLHMIAVQCSNQRINSIVSVHHRINFICLRILYEQELFLFLIWHSTSTHDMKGGINERAKILEGFIVLLKTNEG